MRNSSGLHSGNKEFIPTQGLYFRPSLVGRFPFAHCLAQAVLRFNETLDFNAMEKVSGLHPLPLLFFETFLDCVRQPMRPRQQFFGLRAMPFRNDGQDFSRQVQHIARGPAASAPSPLQL